MELKLYPQHTERSFVRGQNTRDTINLFVGNIYKDSNRNFEEFIEGLNFIYAVEITCGIIMDELDCFALCFDKHYCPIAKTLREYLYNYDIKINNKERYKL